MSQQYFAKDIDGLPNTAVIKSMSGLEFMQKVLAGDLPSAPIAQGFNYLLHAVEDGRVTFRGAPQFDHYNSVGTVHGGWYGTLLDSAMACAVMTRVPKGAVYTTLEYKVNIVRQIPVGMTIDCIGTAQHSGRSTGVATGEIVGVEDGRLYATGSTTCIIMVPR